MDRAVICILERVVKRESVSPFAVKPIPWIRAWGMAERFPSNPDARLHRVLLSEYGRSILTVMSAEVTVHHEHQLRGITYGDDYRQGSLLSRDLLNGCETTR
jgi:hypothetical protein